MAKFRVIEKRSDVSRIASDVVDLVEHELPWLLHNRPGVPKRYVDLSLPPEPAFESIRRHASVQKTRMHLGRTVFWRDLYSGVFYDDDDQPFGFGNVFDNTTVKVPDGTTATLRRTDLWTTAEASVEDSRRAVELAARYHDYGGRVLMALTDAALERATGVPYVMEPLGSVDRVEVEGDDPYRLSRIPGPIKIFTLPALNES